MIRTGCILLARTPEDGLRASVMSRHTLADGVTLDARIGPGAFDEWWRELAPPDRLVGAYYKRSMPWAAFEAAYLEHLIRSVVTLQRLVDASRDARDLTLLCIEESPERCHRRLLAEHVASLGGVVGTIR